MQDASHSLFALMDSEDDDFPTLVARYGIDPATDLQYCDLRNVDFGELIAETLNLTGSNIAGANLSRIRCKNVIGAERETVAQFDALGEMIHRVTFAIKRYQNSDWIWSQIAGEDETETLDLAFYDSAAEQDALTKRLCGHFYNNATVIRDPRQRGLWTKSTAGSELPFLNFLLFYTSKYNSKFEFGPNSLDEAFLDLITGGKSEPIDGPFAALMAANRSSVQKIEKGVEGIGIDEQRIFFSRAVSRELTPGPGQIAFDYAAILFSGYPPISKKFFQDLRAAIRPRLRLVFLCSSELEPYFDEKEGSLSRNVALPNYAIREPLTTRVDLSRLERRIGASSDNRISIGSVTLAKMEKMVERPLREAKGELLKRLDDIKATAAQSRSEVYYL